MSQNVCTICNRADRADIENALLALSPESYKGDSYSLDLIADRFNLSAEELKMHALFHTPLISETDLVVTDHEAGRESLTRKMKLREADMLSVVSNEYLVTLKNMGRQINSLMTSGAPDVLADDQQLRMAKFLTKPMVDLYLGLGGEIRSNVKIMADLDKQLNGPQDNLGSGLTALAEAIRGSDA